MLAAAHINSVVFEDFVSHYLVYEVDLSDSERSKNVSVTIIQDELSELNETFAIILDSILLVDISTGQQFQPDSEEDRSRLQFSIKQCNVTIQDDDGTYV